MNTEKKELILDIKRQAKQLVREQLFKKREKILTVFLENGLFVGLALAIACLFLPKMSESIQDILMVIMAMVLLGGLSAIASSICRHSLKVSPEKLAEAFKKILQEKYEKDQEIVNILSKRMQVLKEIEDMNAQHIL